MDKNQAADALDEIAELLELKGENPFKTRAYTNGARALRAVDEDLATLVAEGRLKEIKGFGDSLIAKVTELFDTGKITFLEDLRSTVPPGLAQMMRIPGLGPKRVQEIHKALGIDTLEALEAAAKEDRLSGLPGMGAKSQAKILAGIEQVRKHGERFRIDVAEAEGERVLDVLERTPGVARIQLAGSLRRRRETIGDLDIVAATTKPKDLMDVFT